MIRELKNSFVQGTLLTIIWLMLITSLIIGKQPLSANYFWRIILISALLSLVFSVIYNYLWNYSTWKASINIAAASLINFGIGYLVIVLYSHAMFELVLPYWWIILLITLILHIIIFYFWRYLQNKKIASTLNQLTK